MKMRRVIVWPEMLDLEDIKAAVKRFVGAVRSSLPRRGMRCDVCGCALVDDHGWISIHCPACQMTAAYEKRLAEERARNRDRARVEQAIGRTIRRPPGDVK